MPSRLSFRNAITWQICIEIMHIYTKSKLHNQGIAWRGSYFHQNMQEDQEQSTYFESIDNRHDDPILKGALFLPIILATIKCDRLIILACAEENAMIVNQIDALYSLTPNIGVMNIFLKKNAVFPAFHLKDVQLVMNHFLWDADWFSERCTLDISKETHWEMHIKIAPFRTKCSMLLERNCTFLSESVALLQMSFVQNSPFTIELCFYVMLYQLWIDPCTGRLGRLGERWRKRRKMKRIRRKRKVRET